MHLDLWLNLHKTPVRLCTNASKINYFKSNQCFKRKCQTKLVHTLATEVLTFFKQDLDTETLLREIKT